MVQFSSNLANVVAAIERESKTRVFAAGNEVRNEWVSVLSGGRSGRTYRVPGTQQTYTASAPGDAPAVLFGDLRRSITVNQPTLENGVAECKIGSALEKALMLEVGTRRIKPRPHAAVAAHKAEPKVKGILEKVWF